MLSLSFNQISERINKLILPEFDLIVGIAEGGIVPASLVAYKLGIELFIIKINYRDINNKPQFELPQILSSFNSEIKNRKILIVDDVSVSGKTMQTASGILKGNFVTTLSLKGKADYVLFPEISECVNWPWKLVPKGEIV